ncbi:hypothetical protein BSI_12090 [Bacillus inaquosorum KCTC 13429]|uniref:Uncharacterized protein n=1 Tax=Bacillus inaquosorum KCTC 13429 TaxID=1236548 RepID=A0A9W5LK40_9BACI|nr:hypothetical protein BSI_12090 [Bacillus inaquosorum KCTC 13429]
MNAKAAVIPFVSNDCLILSQPMTPLANKHYNEKYQVKENDVCLYE